MANLLFLLGLGIFLRELFLLSKKEDKLETETLYFNTNTDELKELDESSLNPITTGSNNGSDYLNDNYLNTRTTGNLIKFIKDSEQFVLGEPTSDLLEILMDREFELLYRFTCTMEKFTPEEVNFIKSKYIDFEYFNFPAEETECDM